MLSPPRHPRDGIAKAAVAGWVALYLSLLGWCLFPATRWDALYGRLEGTEADRPVLEGLYELRQRELGMRPQTDDLSTDSLRQRMHNRWSTGWAVLTQPLNAAEN